LLTGHGHSLGRWWHPVAPT